eukprot:201463_1
MEIEPSMDSDPTPTKPVGEADENSHINIFTDSDESSDKLEKPDVEKPSMNGSGSPKAVSDEPEVAAGEPDSSAGEPPADELDGSADEQEMSDDKLDKVVSADEPTDTVEKPEAETELPSVESEKAESSEEVSEASGADESKEDLEAPAVGDEPQLPEESAEDVPKSTENTMSEDPAVGEPQLSEESAEDVPKSTENTMSEDTAVGEPQLSEESADDESKSTENTISEDPAVGEPQLSEGSADDEPKLAEDTISNTTMSEDPAAIDGSVSEGESEEYAVDESQESEGSHDEPKLSENQPEEPTADESKLFADALLGTVRDETTMASDNSSASSIVPSPSYSPEVSGSEMAQLSEAISAADEVTSVAYETTITADETINPADETETSEKQISTDSSPQKDNIESQEQSESKPVDDNTQEQSEPKPEVGSDDDMDIESESSPEEVLADEPEKPAGGGQQPAVADGASIEDGELPLPMDLPKLGHILAPMIDRKRGLAEEALPAITDSSAVAGQKRSSTEPTDSDATPSKRPRVSEALSVDVSEAPSADVSEARPTDPRLKADDSRGARDGGRRSRSNSRRSGGRFGRRSLSRDRGDRQRDGWRQQNRQRRSRSPRPRRPRSRSRSPRRGDFLGGARSPPRPKRASRWGARVGEAAPRVPRDEYRTSRYEPKGAADQRGRGERPNMDRGRQQNNQNNSFPPRNSDRNQPPSRPNMPNRQPEPSKTGPNNIIGAPHTPVDSPVGTPKTFGAPSMNSGGGAWTTTAFRPDQPTQFGQPIQQAPVPQPFLQNQWAPFNQGPPVQSFNQGFPPQPFQNNMGVPGFPGPGMGMNNPGMNQFTMNEQPGMNPFNTNNPGMNQQPVMNNAPGMNNQQPGMNQQWAPPPETGGMNQFGNPPPMSFQPGAAPMGADNSNIQPQMVPQPPIPPFSSDSLIPPPKDSSKRLLSPQFGQHSGSSPQSPQLSRSPQLHMDMDATDMTVLEEPLGLHPAHGGIPPAHGLPVAGSTKNPSKPRDRATEKEALLAIAHAVKKALHKHKSLARDKNKFKLIAKKATDRLFKNWREKGGATISGFLNTKRRAKLADLISKYVARLH